MLTTVLQLHKPLNHKTAPSEVYGTVPPYCPKFSKLAEAYGGFCYWSLYEAKKKKSWDVASDAKRHILDIFSPSNHVSKKEYLSNVTLYRGTIRGHHAVRT